MRTVHSIEPLKPHLLSLIKEETGGNVSYIDRLTFFDCKDEHSKVEVMICRDRDNVSSIIDACPNLKMLFIVSTGVEKLPFDKLRNSNVVVGNTGGVNCDIMSQYAMGYILSQSARVCENLINQKNHYWKKFQCVDSLEGKNLLIVGAGRTGQLIAAKATPFGMNCVGIKNHISELANFQEVTTLENLDKYLAWADFVVCTIPLTPSTVGLFNYDRFCKMKPTATFINISRGKHVVTTDLIRALKEEKLKSAILDVFETEPIPQDSELWDLPNLYLTPHSSGRLENFMDEAIHYFINNYNAFLEGKVLPNKVNLTDGY